jgi:hypothetical protein
MKKLIYIFALIFFFLVVEANAGEEMLVQEYSGVVTYHLIPAKVIKINKIIENPKPGTSYIGEEAILVEVEGNPNVMANWTVVRIKYYKYHEPKTIKYEILSEQHEITVNYHAVSVDVTGDLSSYIKEE